MASYTSLPLNPRAPLTRIPIEVLLQITYHLNTPELCNLRLTCKIVEASLLESFTKEFFTKRQFMISTFSLQAFLDISRSRFAYSLNHVILGSEQLSSNPSVVYPPVRDPHSGVTPPVDLYRVHQEKIDRNLMMNSGQHLDILAEAFSNLANLQTVGLRDFYSRSRRRDYPNTQWRSYGVKTFELATGTRFMFSDVHDVQNLVDPNYIERMFLDILRALGRATSRPKSFEVILRHKRLDDFAFTVPQHVVPAVQSALMNLRTIFLDLWRDMFPTRVSQDGKEIPCPNYQLRLFLARLPQLEHLRLNFHSAIFSDDGEEDFLLWLGNPNCPTNAQSVASTSLPHAPPAITFANLKQLNLGHFKAKPQTIIAIVAKYQATVRGISFHEATLRLRSEAVNNYSPHATLDANDEDKPKPNYWATLLSQLSKLEQLNLSSMTLSRIRVEEQRFSHNCLFKNTSSRDPRVRHWAGNNIQSGLRDLAASVYVDRQKPFVVDPETDESGDGDEDGDDDDEEGDHDSEEDGSGSDDADEGDENS